MSRLWCEIFTWNFPCSFIFAAVAARSRPLVAATTERLSQSDVQLNQVAENAIADLKSK